MLQDDNDALVRDGVDILGFKGKKVGQVLIILLCNTLKLKKRSCENCEAYFKRKVN